MKTGIFATGVITLVVGLITLNSFMLHKSIGEFIEDAEALSIQSEDAYEKAEDIKRKFEDAERFISLTVNHEDLTNIEECYSDLLGYLSVGMTREAEVTKNRLIDALSHLRRLSGVNLDSVI